ncbi:MAG: protein-export chaperone SecB [Pseudomonadales bacterium]|jgi:preprotein translocase subunit SecB|uniref:protein-export chaperone SecB n=1 Tax=unclassified Ketobacter TaxID=2639109 RepID=UPI000C6748EA|nr:MULTISPECIES: protein-export chaperone SecB [unclassified Ketobacter]MAQ27558.1 protein-export chaperone SecB [Pseudomonadales bacterium]MEC8813197.1 protein-export chaperone SecB [Pseudomonadota bacterium]HAG92912.1 protein-export chaperone SecB [Gammaproteobacteria bacterium]MBI27262.1 protein-export chaperone SecB [Pseudomonadales bacterium]MCK5790056.1 protein-export chaperone SecB [Ketobacter sp.]|tara:strand:+ start:13915 stop:14394 length:480 start_codon:yes stop_codon:yes gene_type:complete
MTEQAAGQQPEQQFQLQRIFLKDLSYEAPKTPQLFKEQWKPEVNLEVNNTASEIESGIYEVVLKVTVTVKNGENTAFIAEVAQAGLFLLQGVEGIQKEAILKGVCANILFPYARETISDVVARGTFPQFLLQPINFEAAFAENLRKQQEQAKQGAQPTH